MANLSSEQASPEEKTPRIHLLMTCLVTNIRRDGSISSDERAEALIECLKSLQEMSFVSASIYISIGDDIRIDKSKFDAEVNQLSKKVMLHSSRLEYFADWKNAVSRPEVQASDAVLLLSYEDHILRKGRSSVVIDAVRSINRATETYPSGHFISILSHFPEQQILSDCWSAVGFRSPTGDPGAIPAPTPIGCLVTKPSVLLDWFSRDFTEGNRIVAPENYFGPSVSDSKSISLTITKEAFYHKDGYGHVKLFNNEPQSPQAQPQTETGLLGKSNTWQAQVRLGSPLTFNQYAKSQVSSSGMSGIRLVLRSISLAIVSRITNFGFVERSIRAHVANHPGLAHYLSMGFSHGLLRYLLILIRAYFRHRVFVKFKI
jgi:hypothetical protein